MKTTNRSELSKSDKAKKTTINTVINLDAVKRIEIKIYEMNKDLLLHNNSTPSPDVSILKNVCLFLKIISPYPVQKLIIYNKIYYKNLNFI